MITFTVTSTIPSDAITNVVFEVGKEHSYIKADNGKQSLVIGIKDIEKITRRKYILLARQIIALAKAHRIENIAIEFSSLKFPRLRMTDEEKAEVLVTNMEMAAFDFVEHKTAPEEGWPEIREVFLVTPKNIQKAVAKGQIIGQEVNKSRRLATNPGGEITPKMLAAAAKESVEGLPVKVDILSKSDITKLGMGGVLGVAQGSSEEPQFIILEYFGGKKSEKPIVLAGKGVTFDTGGLNIKPGDYMYEMHMDMSGGAAVIHAVAAAAKLKIKKNVVALVPAVENMPSGSSYHPGDILKTMSGKTIEVLNTDAEGRVILADALTYAEKYEPRLVVDVATLTGAAVVALG
ncbi:MAG: leucyl aminopeptidase family protein, partial [archaeon]|nr:leucyl aminopeptidase family protein [archaeon]